MEFIKRYSKKLWAVLTTIILAPFKAFLWLWRWITKKPTFRITVTYDTKFGNKDDVVFENVAKINKQTMKELNFITTDKKTVNFRANAGLNYRIEQE